MKLSFSKTTVFLLYGLAVLSNVLWLGGQQFLSVWREMALVLLAMALVTLAAYGWAKNPNAPPKIWTYTGWVVFLYYAAIMGVMLFLGGIFGIFRGAVGGMNWVPFATIGNFWRNFLRTGSMHSLTNLIGNVLGFAPMGLFLPLLLPAMRRWYLFFLSVGALIAAVELLQHMTRTGSLDIDDWILNMLGAGLVYACTMGLLAWRRRKCAKLTRL